MHSFTQRGLSSPQSHAQGILLHKHHHTTLPRTQRRRQQPLFTSGASTSESSQATQQQQEELKQKARVAAKGAQSKLKDLYDSAQASAGRTWTRLDSEYSLSSKAERAGKRAEETWRDVDQTWNVRRRLRNTVEEVQRKWPVWQAQLDQFATTWYGKTTLLIVIVAVISSPIFWRLMNIVLLVWWLAIPIAAALVNTVQKRAVQRAQQEAEEEAARRANPFADIFGSKSSKSPSRMKQQDGPVIEAEYVTVSKEDSSSK